MAPRLISDINQAGYQAWWFPALGLIFFLIGLALMAINRFRKMRVVPAISSRAGQPAPYLPWLFMGFALLWSGFAFASTFNDYRELREALNHGRCQMIEGSIEHLHTGSGERGDTDDWFDIHGSRFSYSDNITVPGFGQTQARGGPLKEGMRIRIYAYQGQIARLEILP